MTTDAGKTEGQEPATNAGGQTAPMSDLIALRRKLESTEQAARTAQEAAAADRIDLTAKIEKLEAEAQRPGASSEDIEAAKKATFAARKELKEAQEALAKDRADFAVEKLEGAKIKLAAQYGVDVELFKELDSPVEMELVAVKKSLEKFASAKPADFDTSGGSGGAAPTTEMDRAGLVLAKEDKRRGRVVDSESTA